ncbi:MAG: hypothetical protein IIA61_06050 [Candidatus Marinimicrobia bacterium]|nr:hypothetical protein [Candidatus Neomarinimicrobiota bacterium]
MQKFRNINLKASLFLIVSFSLLWVSNCSIENPLDDFTVGVDFSPVAMVFGGQIVNAATRQPLSNTSVNVTLSGDGSKHVVDLAGNSVTSLRITSGFLTFALEEGIKPSAASPIKFNIIVHAEGFIPSSKPMVIEDTRNQQFTIRMVEIGNTPEGVVATVVTEGQVDESGAVTEDLIVETSPEPNTGATASISIEKGTIIRDASGNLLSGKLTTSVVYYNNQSEQSLAAFPGGFFVTITEDATGSPAEGTFVSAGFVAIEITDESGNVAASFDPPVTITMQVPEGTINPQTEVEVKSGDVIPIWSYNNETGEWKWEYDAVAEVTGGLSKGNGKSSLSFPVRHMSLFNMDWHYPGKCVTGTISVVGNPDEVFLDFKIKPQAGGSYMYFSNRDASDPNNITVFNAPPNLPMTLEAYWEGSLVGSLDIVDLCGFTALTLNVDLPEPELTDVTFQIMAFCTDIEDVEIRPTMPIHYRREGSTELYTTVFMIAGHLEILGLQVGKTYEFLAEYEGEVGDTVLFIEPDMADIILDLEIPAFICGDMPGVNGLVYGLAVAANGDLYAGGEFSEASALVSANYIVLWDGSSWHPLGADTSSIVSAIAVSGNDVYVGGGVRTVSGAPANSIARWDGSSWHPLAAGVNGPVFAIAVSGDDVYVGAPSARQVVIR